MIKLIYKVLGVKIGKKNKYKGIPIIYTKKRGNITIGDNVRINSSILSNLLGIYCRSIIVARTKEAIIKIGKNSGLSGCTLYARKEISIGENVKIGANVKIFDNDFHPIDPIDRLNGKNDLILKPVKIGNNVFIGCNSIILKGTNIGDNSVIGAGSVVSGTFPDNCVIAGNPAKIIKYL